MDRSSSIRALAAQTLHDYEQRAERAALGESRGSVAILEDLARHRFDLTTLDDWDLPLTVRGALDLDAGIIALQPRLTAAQKTFTLAHEIAHCALAHPPRQIQDGADQLDDEPDASALDAANGIYQSPVARSYNQRDRWELEANLFAAELLAPGAQVRERITLETDWSIASLSKYFGLSHGAMRNQLAAALLSPNQQINLCVTKPDEISISVSLDEKQRLAATAPTPALVIAGPGAGKTRVLVERFVHLVERGEEPRRILALTFSNKAAGEMRERLEKALPWCAAEIHVATFHSLGLDLLRGYGTRIGLQRDLRVLSEVDAWVFLESRIARLPLGRLSALHQPARHLEEVLALISRAKDELASPDEFRDLAGRWNAELQCREKSTAADGEEIEVEINHAARALDIAEVYATYQKWLREEGVVDFGDLIMEAVRLFDVPAIAQTIRDTYDHILVDEFQDINFASGRLVRALDGGRGVVWAVGDPRQSIYGFRGASPVNLERFGDDYAGAQTIALEWNYRSVESIVCAGEAVPFPDEAPSQVLHAPPLHSGRGNESTLDGEPAIEFIEALNTDEELAAIVARVQEALATNEPGDIAILCRRRALAQKVSDVLEAHDIATNWSGALEDDETFKDLMAVLLLAADDAQSVLRLNRLSEHAFSPDDLQRLLSNAGQCHSSAQRLLERAACGEIEGLTAQGRAQAQKLKLLAQSLRHEATPWQALSSYLFAHAAWTRELWAQESPRARRQMAAIARLASLARTFEGRATTSDSDDANVMQEFVDWVRACRRAGSLNPAGGPIARDAQAINVLTIHAAKGLEWPLVIVPDAVAESARDEIFSMPPGLVHRAAMDEAAVRETEEACLLYVALTRARDRLIVSRPNAHGKRVVRPSRFWTPLLETLTANGHARLTHAADIVPATIAETEVDGGGLARRDQSTLDAPLRVRTFNEALAKPRSYRLLNEFETCGRRVEYERIYGLVGDEDGYQKFHRSVYAVMEQIAAQAAQGEVPSPQEAGRWLEAWWQEVGPHDHRLEPIYRRYAASAVETFTARLRPDRKILLRQKRQVEIGKRSIDFTVDEIEEVPDGAPIWRRHHFGHAAKSHSDEDLLFLLAVAHNQSTLDGSIADIRVHYLLTGEEEAVLLTPRKTANRLKKMERLADEWEAGQFQARPSLFNCAQCRFNLICPA